MLLAAELPAGRWIYSLSAWIYPTAKELSVERLYRSRSLKNSRSGIFCKLVVPTRKPTYSGDRRTNTPSVLHEDTRPTHGPTHVRNSVEGYQKTQRTIKLTGKSSHEPGSATRQAGRDLRRRPTTLPETVTLLKENSFSHPPNSQRGRT